MSGNLASGVDLLAEQTRQTQARAIAPEELSWRELTDLFTKQTGTINALWSNYSTVAGVMMTGVGVATVTKPLTWQTKLALSLAFAMFSEGNFRLLRQACRIHVRLAAAIVDKLAAHRATLAPSYGELLRTVAATANSPRWVMLYHFTIDACIVATIWLSATVLSAATGT